MDGKTISGRLVTSCQICGSKKLKPVISFGHHSVTQAYLDKKTLHEPETLYPLNLIRCQDCWLIQLDYVVDPRVVFPKSYPYRTGLTKMLIRNFENLAETVVATRGLSTKDVVVDIGSNDGSLLKSFQIRGAKVVGVEPTNAAKDANHAGVPTLQTFFGRKAVQQIRKKYGPANIITCTNTFAHIDGVRELVGIIKLLLARDGVFISESQYLLDILEKLEFDTVYHEHLRFYSLKPLARLFALNGMTLVDAERITAAGGSIRAYAKIGRHAPSLRLRRLIAAEERAGVYQPATYERFSKKIAQAKFDFLSLLVDLKKRGRPIVGLTSSARSNSLLSTCKIDNHILDYLCEKAGSPKIGLLTPGTHIPVVDEKQLFSKQPPYLVILSWHIGAELAEKMRKSGYHGKFIIPLPKVKLIN